eukprot:694420-Rhodomonas_salina.1
MQKPFKRHPEFEDLLAKCYPLPLCASSLSTNPYPYVPRSPTPCPYALRLCAMNLSTTPCPYVLKLLPRTSRCYTVRRVCVTTAASLHVTCTCRSASHVRLQYSRL